jgi:hypothetical protein
MDNASDWTYFNYPQPTPLSSYSIEIDRYIQHASNVDDVTAIYSMGSIKCPGISDIDLIVVTKDRVKDAPHLSVSNTNYNDNLFMHDVIVISESVFRYLQFIFYASNLTLLWERPGHGDLVVDMVPNRERALALLLDFTESRLLEFHVLFNTRQVNIRKWLTKLGSFRHTVKLAAEIMGPDIKNRYAHVLAELSHLRQMWSESNRFELGFFRTVLLKTARAFSDILNSLSHIPELSYSHPNHNSRIIINNKIITFSSNASYQTNFKEVTIPFKKKRHYSFVELPNFYLIHLAGYYHSETEIPCLNGLRKIRQGLPDSNYRDFQSERIRAILEHWAFLKQNNIHYSMTGYICFSPTFVSRLAIRLVDYLMIRTLVHLQ